MLTLLIAAALMLAAATSGDAQQTDSVQVHGAVVMAPLSLTIPDGPVSFERIDAARQPHAHIGGMWLAVGQMPITIGSPAPVIVTVCVNAVHNLHASRIFESGNLNLPGTATLLQPALTLDSCPQPIPWVVLNPADYSRSFTGDLWMQPLDPALPLSATVIISLSM